MISSAFDARQTQALPASAAPAAFYSGGAAQPRAAKASPAAAPKAAAAKRAPKNKAAAAPARSAPAGGEGRSKRQRVAPQLYEAEPAPAPRELHRQERAKQTAARR